MGQKRTTFLLQITIISAVNTLHSRYEKHFDVIATHAFDFINDAKHKM
jgi:hypothetical protein